MKRSIIISVITLTWNSETHIRKMLDSVIEDSSESGVDIEIFVVDNGSKDRTVQILKEYRERYSWIHLVLFGQNTGTTFSRNTAIRSCIGEYVLILDSDTIVGKGTIAGLLTGYNEIDSKHGNKLGILHPQLCFPDGTFQESARRFPTPAIKFARFFGLEKKRERLESLEVVLKKRIGRVDYAISAAWFMKRVLFDKVGYLDEKIFYAPEDAEFCARLWHKEYEVWFDPRITIVHDCQRLTRKRPFSRIAVKHFVGLLYFWRKYGINKMSRSKVD